MTTTPPPDLDATVSEMGKLLGLDDETIAKAKATIAEHGPEEALNLAMKVLRDAAPATPIPAAAGPAEAEGTGATSISLPYKGVTVVLPARVEEWDLDALAAFERGQAASAFQGLMGPKYAAFAAEFQKANGRKPNVGDLEGLMEIVAEAYGFTSTGG